MCYFTTFHLLIKIGFWSLILFLFFGALQKLFCNFCSHHKITHNLHHLLHNVCNSSSDILPFWLAKSNFCHFSKLKSCGPKQFQSNVWTWKFFHQYVMILIFLFPFQYTEINYFFRIHFLLLNSSEILFLRFSSWKKI